VQLITAGHPQPLGYHPPVDTVGDSAEVIPLPAQGHDRIAARDINDIVMDGLFFAGLALETVLGRMGGHPEAGMVPEVIGELDLAIRDVRNVVFDHHRPDPSSGGQPG
jgi:hypothetical protein